MTENELRAALCRLCQDYGDMTDYSYDLVEALVGSIATEPDEDEA